MSLRHLIPDVPGSVTGPPELHSIQLLCLFSLMSLRLSTQGSRVQWECRTFPQGGSRSEKRVLEEFALFEFVASFWHGASRWHNPQSYAESLIRIAQVRFKRNMRLSMILPAPGVSCTIAPKKGAGTVMFQSRCVGDKGIKQWIHGVSVQAFVGTIAR